jgi:transaldolase
MRILIALANIKQIKKAVLYGLLDGVTTNPSLVTKEVLNFREHLIHI